MRNVVSIPKPEPDRRFGDLVRRYREAAGLSQQALAESAGMSERGIRYLENGTRRPYPDTLRRLADALALTPEQRDTFAAATRSSATPAPAEMVAVSSFPGTLPTAPAPLLGRDHDVTAVTALLTEQDVRLVTLTGPGGVGKTRLALAVAASEQARYAGKTVFVALATVSDPDLVLPEIARALGIREGGDRSLQTLVADALRERDLLLLLDNYEQVLAAAPLVAQLLSDAPRLTVLVTSRAPLHLRAERPYPVHPLALPDPAEQSRAALLAAPAVALFVARASVARPGFTLSERDAADVATICARLDGLPLGIELAAARIALLSPSALLARLTGRLRLLTGGANDLPDRQQTLRAAIDWSYRLLSPAEQSLFGRLAIFTGGATLDAIAAVCDMYERDRDEDDMDVLDGMTVLVRHSLVRQEEGRDGESRFRFLETIHEFAGERLTASGEKALLTERHAEYFLAMVIEAGTGLTGPDQAWWLARLEDEHDNLRAALGGIIARGDADTALRFVEGIWWFWLVRGHLSEGRRWMDTVLALPAGDTAAVRAAVLNGAGTLARDQGEYTAAVALYEESLAIRRGLDDPLGVSYALNNLGMIAWSQGHYEEARRLHEESLAIRRTLDHPLSLAFSLNNLGLVVQSQGETIAARALFEESLAIRRAINDRRGIAQTLGNLGELARGIRDDESARALHEESLTIMQELGDQRGIAAALSSLGALARRAGESTRARALYAESLAIRRAITDKAGIAASLEGLALIAVRTGQHVRAARLFGTAEAVRETLGERLSVAERADHERAVRCGRTAIDTASWETAWSAGRAMLLEQAITEAMSDE